LRWQKVSTFYSIRYAYRPLCMNLSTVYCGRSEHAANSNSTTNVTFICFVFKFLKLRDQRNLKGSQPEGF